jgi:hypothetical protein
MPHGSGRDPGPRVATASPDTAIVPAKPEQRDVNILASAVAAARLGLAEQLRTALTSSPAVALARCGSAVAHSALRCCHAANSEGLASDALQHLFRQPAANSIGLATNALNHLCDRDAEGRTCLHLAAGYGHEECLQLLLDAKSSDPKAADANGDTPLAFAAIHGHAMCAFNLAKVRPGVLGNLL